jgi:hypothetical protein
MATEREQLLAKYASRIAVNPALSRALVSYQANKNEPIYSWLKYREGFAAPLVRHLLSVLHPKPGKLLDPFAGASTALFAAQELGWRTLGIELLPIGIAFAEARLAAGRVPFSNLKKAMTGLVSSNWPTSENGRWKFPHIRITAGAFPTETERLLEKFRSYCRRRVPDKDIRYLLEFAGMCVLEDVSFTRKDGQYLRWDRRAPGRELRGSFTKGRIKGFREALREQLTRMLSDMENGSHERHLMGALPSENGMGPPPELLEGSCLENLPRLRESDFDIVFTSPPYCNRYDYTRTYALELAYLGCNDRQVSELRQKLLSCTVENREKMGFLEALYSDLGRKAFYQKAEAAFLNQRALQEVLQSLEKKRRDGQLNNSNIVRMVRNYFFEMSLVAFEIARVLSPGGRVVMINDNVRYAGEEVPVDLILSEFAAAAGLSVESVWTLGTGKGNSSQQMGKHGRAELRKSVCVWRKGPSEDKGKKVDDGGSHVKPVAERTSRLGGIRQLRPARDLLCQETE